MLLASRGDSSDALKAVVAEKARLLPKVLAVLHLAAMQGDVELLKALLPHKPDLDAKDGQGRSVPIFSISAIDFFQS